MPNAKSQRLLYSALVSSHRRRRQPIHTVYGGAHLFKADTAARLGTTALRVMQEYAPDSAALAAVLGLTPEIAARVHARVIEKLRREPVEDFRLDFEDGYGNRPDDEEDGHAESAAVEVATGGHKGTLPPFVGIRIKNLGPDVRERALRTTHVFLERLLRETGRQLPPNFVVTLPKITHSSQVGILADAVAKVETAHHLAAGTLRMELMVETPQSMFDPDGAVDAFFRESLDAASERLLNFIAKAAEATLVGEVFDDAATGQGLLNFFLRALNCGAVREEEIGSLTGLTLDELRSGSFVKIVEARRG